MLGSCSGSSICDDTIGLPVRSSSQEAQQDLCRLRHVRDHSLAGLAASPILRFPSPLANLTGRHRHDERTTSDCPVRTWLVRKDYTSRQMTFEVCGCASAAGLLGLHYDGAGGMRQAMAQLCSGKCWSGCEVRGMFPLPNGTTAGLQPVRKLARDTIIRRATHCWRHSKSLFMLSGVRRSELQSMTCKVFLMWKTLYHGTSPLDSSAWIET